MPRPSDPNLITSTEARGYLGSKEKPIAHDTLLNYVERGLLRQYHGKIGKSVYYDQRELDALLRIVPQRGTQKFIMPPIVGNFEDYLREKYSSLTPHSTFIGGSAEVLPVPGSIAPLLQVPELTRVVCQRVLQGAIEPGQQGGEWTRWRFIEHWYHPQFVDKQMCAEMGGDTAFDTMIAIRQRYGVAVKELLIRVLARKPAPEELGLLLMTLDQPVIEMLYVNCTLPHRDIVMVNRLVFNAEMFELEFEYPDGLWGEK